MNPIDRIIGLKKFGGDMSVAVTRSTCCSGLTHERPLSDTLFYSLEKITAVALGVFCAYTDIQLFIPFFAIGVGVSIYEHYSGNEREGCGDPTSCSQGFMEQLTGVKLPPLLSLMTNLAVTWCHIEHHTKVFVPIIGISIGAWMGKSVTRLIF